MLLESCLIFVHFVIFVASSFVFVNLIVVVFAVIFITVTVIIFDVVTNIITAICYRFRLIPRSRLTVPCHLPYLANC